MLADQIINLDLQQIATDFNQNLPQLPAPHLPASQIRAPQLIQSGDKAGIYTELFRQNPNLCWQQGHLIGALVKNFRQIKYLPFTNAVPDIDQALYGVRLDCGKDLHKQLIEYNGAAKVWMFI